MTPAPQLAVFAVVATLGYLGLAILGWGGFAGFFSHPALIALASTLFVLTGIALFSGGNLSPGEREDRANRWVIAAFRVIGVLAAYLPALRGNSSENVENVGRSGVILAIWHFFDLLPEGAADPQPQYKCPTRAWPAGPSRNDFLRVRRTRFNP